MDINVYDIASNSWSNLTTLTYRNALWYIDSNGEFGYTPQTFINGDLIWISGSTLYILTPTQFNNVGYHSTESNLHPALVKINKNDGTKISTLDLSGTLGGTDSWGNGNFSRNKHKTVVKTLSGKIFIINWYLKQIWEFLPASDVFVNCSVTWPSTGNWLTCESGASGPTACAYGDDVYLMGASGQNYEQGTFNYIYSFDGSEGGTRTFTQKGAINVAFGDMTNQAYFPRNGTLFNLGNSLFWYGGTYDGTRSNGSSSGENNNTVTKLMRYDIITNTWFQVSTLSTIPYINHSAVSTPNGAFFFGGTVSNQSSKITNSFSYILETPTNLRGIYNSTTQAIDLNWTDNSTEETNFILERKRDDEAVFTELAVLPANTTSYSDSNVAIHSHYYSYKLYCEMAI